MKPVNWSRNLRLAFALDQAEAGGKKWARKEGCKGKNFQKKEGKAFCSLSRELYLPFFIALRISWNRLSSATSLQAWCHMGLKESYYILKRSFTIFTSGKPWQTDANANVPTGQPVHLTVRLTVSYWRFVCLSRWNVILLDFHVLCSCIVLHIGCRWCASICLFN